MEKLSYQSITHESKSEIKIKGSRFLGFAYPVEGEESVNEYLRDLRAAYPDATHHCYAYRLGINGEQERANDDGEPSNSAGRPILRQLYSLELTNCLVVVVRYYGGTKLGVGGLIDAYGSAAQLALEASDIVEKELKQRVEVNYEYAEEGLAFRLLEQLGCEADRIERGASGKLVFHVPLSKREQLNELKATYYSLQIEIDESD